LRDLLRTAGVAWIEDPSNAEESARAAVRSYLIPVISERFGPRAVEGLARSAALVEEWSESIDAQAGDAFTRATQCSRRGTFLDLPALRDYPRAVRRRVLRRVLASCGCATALLSSAVGDLLELCDGNRSRRQQLPSGMEAIRSGAVVRIASPGTASPLTSVRVPVPGRLAVGGWVLDVSTLWPGHGHVTRLPGRSTVALLDRDEVQEPLFVRGRLPGDSVSPMGMTGRVKLKKYLRDHGIPRWERWSTPIVCDASGRVLWLPGIVRSRDARIDPETRRMIVLQGTNVAMQEEERSA
jgi:tRNA(Ile)-lysidine synthase